MAEQMLTYLVGDAVAAADGLYGFGQLLGVKPLLAEELAAESWVLLQALDQVLHTCELVLPALLDVLRARYRPL